MAEKKKTGSARQARQQGAGAAPQPAPGYAVLARKYRPRTFDDLIGQEAMVRTLRNAFASGRIAQAYMLTGVRGVGKTTTARILARALNYEREGIDGPTIDMGEPGVHCAAIMESRHVDVLEMDAASHTGIDDIREIIESARYKPVSARTKVYIIDEVHMLSRAAFNGLLKTLEEPPDHVKFIFATTEIRKVPVTVLSRCQRFDLRRVDSDTLKEHFAGIAEQEGVAVSDEALTLIARAAEGSVRDGLSILDQAIAHAAGEVGADHVRAMLGLADRGRIFDLLEAVFRGDAKAALNGLGALHLDGAEPERVLTDLADAVHVVTRIAAAGADAADPTLSEGERDRAQQLAAKLDMPALARAWQMLLKGIGEARTAQRPLAAAEMLLLRMCYLTGQPSPEELARMLAGEPSVPPGADAAAGPKPGPDAQALAPAGPGGGAPHGAARALKLEESAAAGEPALPEPPQASAPAAEAVPESFEALVELVESRREVKLARALRNGVRLVSYAPPSVEFNLVEGSDPGLANELRAFLGRETGRQWVVAFSDAPGEKTLAERERERAREAEARRLAELEAIRAHPAVQEVLQHFPGAEITDVRPLGGDGEEDTGE
ncbi:MAG: DNA polymerase III subunit gamma/tau [Alphaproteobacteria bacterium]|nr:MAG: DNA polymerase III subunit gamma/tau [Alphaproteobacteria bacterium]